MLEGSDSRRLSEVPGGCRAGVNSLDAGEEGVTVQAGLLHRGGHRHGDSQVEGGLFWICEIISKSSNLLTQVVHTYMNHKQRVITK